MRIVQYPHPSLKHPGKPVANVDKELRLRIGEMFELMYDAKGVGLAATQVALPYRLLVMNMSADSEKPELEQTFLNPRIVRRKGIVDDEEGCLSFPGLFVKVKRSKEVTVEAYDLAGELCTIQAKGWEARAWQHEIDHLDGIVFTQRFGPLAKISSASDVKAFERRFRKLQESGEIPPDVELERMLHALEQEMAAR